MAVRLRFPPKVLGREVFQDSKFLFSDRTIAIYLTNALFLENFINKNFI